MARYSAISLWGLGIAASAVVLSGCGVHTSTPVVPKIPTPKSSTKVSRSGGIVPLVTGATPPAARDLQPTTVEKYPSAADSGTNYTMKAPLVPGTGMDTISVAFSQKGFVATMTVTSSQGKTLWTLPHAARISVEEFGPRHSPVVLVGSDQTFCGSGGCLFTSYTYDAAARKFVVVPLDPWNNLNYLWNATRHNWYAQPAASTPRGSLGGASLTMSGLSTGSRLYNSTFGYMTQNWVYATNGTSSGEWLASGPTNFGKDQLSPMAPYPASSLNLLASEYFGLLMEDHPKSAAKFVAPSANAQHLFEQNQFVTGWGLSGQVGTSSTPAQNTTAISVPLWTMVGTGPNQKLVRYRATATGMAKAGGWFITRTATTRTALKVDTVHAVLALLAKNPAAQTWLKTHPTSHLTISLDANGHGNTWQASFSTASSSVGFTLLVNAETGAVSQATQVPSSQ